MKTKPEKDKIFWSLLLQSVLETKEKSWTRQTNPVSRKYPPAPAHHFLA